MHLLNIIIKNKAVILLLALNVFTAPALAAGPYVFTTSPMINAKEAQRVYGPVVNFLSHVTGEHFVYRTAINWIQYQQWTRKNKADVYFDGAHFAAWRIHNQNAVLGPRVSSNEVYVMFSRRGSGITSIDDTYGKRFCAKPAPSLSGLWSNTYYANPSKLPAYVLLNNQKSIFDSVMDKKCDYGVMLQAALSKMDTGHVMNTFLLSSTFPGPVFTFSRRLPTTVIDKIRSALLSPAGEAATKALRNSFFTGRLVKARLSRYAPMEQGLTNYWSTMYFGLN